jgi:signal transduction histidine kinase
MPKKTPQNVDFPWLVETYFSDPARQRTLNQGEILMEQGGFNNRLYLVVSGTLAAYVKRPDKGLLKLFDSTENMFVGIYSFFSRTFISSATVVAETRCQVAFIEPNQIAESGDQGCGLIEQFMPIVVEELLQRQQRELDFALDKENALKKLAESEKLASLGQMAAGIAHELNNAISVLQSNTNWLIKQINQYFEQRLPDAFQFYTRGVSEGRKISSREVRRTTQELVRKQHVAEATARKLAEMGWFEVPEKLLQQLEQLHYFWEIGSAFHDMKIASQHAAHVVKSVKDLATSESAEMQPVDVNQTLAEALALLTSPLRKVNVNLQLTPLPLTRTSRGALVQVWSNLIKNALESLEALPESRRTISINSFFVESTIFIEISDNGPGISPDDLPKIFQPNFTTKEKGLNFGLGLGLTIVARIINQSDGTIQVASEPGNTKFSITLPIKGVLGETSNHLY